jgi:hypothetical protein
MSLCAYIWLAGKERWIGPKAELGFHMAHWAEDHRRGVHGGERHGGDLFRPPRLHGPRAGRRLSALRAESGCFSGHSEFPSLLLAGIAGGVDKRAGRKA